MQSIKFPLIVPLTNWIDVATQAPNVVIACTRYHKHLKRDAPQIMRTPDYQKSCQLYFGLKISTISHSPYSIYLPFELKTVTKQTATK